MKLSQMDAVIMFRPFRLLVAPSSCPPHVWSLWLQEDTIGSVPSVIGKACAAISKRLSGPACLLCQTRKPLPSDQLQLFSASRPFEAVAIVIFGTQKGNPYVVVMVDRFSRWIELAPVLCTTASLLLMLLWIA